VIITRLLAVLVVAMVVTSILGFTLFGRQEGTSATALVSLAIGGAAAVLGLIFGFREAHQARDSSRSCHGSYVPAGLCPTSTYVQHALPVVLTQPPIDLHRKKDEVLCLATAAAPSYERDISKEQIS
jgi:hypothetical protein